MSVSAEIDASTDLKKGPHLVDDAVRHAGELVQRWQKRTRQAARSDLENYRNGDIDFLFEFGPQNSRGTKRIFDRGQQIPANVTKVLAKFTVDHTRRKVSDVSLDILAGYVCVIAYRDEVPVFVQNLSVMEEVKEIVPATFTVWFESHDKAEKLWGNLVGESIFDGLLKPGFGFRKGKLNAAFLPGAGGGTGHDLPIAVIKGVSKVGENIASDDGALVRDGLIFFGVGGALIGLGVRLQDVDEGRRFSDKLVKLLDVFRGPINL